MSPLSRAVRTGSYAHTISSEAPASRARSAAAATARCAVSDPSVPTTMQEYTGRSYGQRFYPPSEPMRPFWIWMQVVILLCVIASAVIAVVKLYG
jgi:hypothetical protein